MMGLLCREKNLMTSLAVAMHVCSMSIGDVIGTSPIVPHTSVAQYKLILIPDN